MFVIEVIPLRRGAHIDTLSYFSSETYPIGALVTIHIRNSEALGLVTNIEEVSTAKTALRAATFSLRKLPPQTSAQRLSPILIKTAEHLAKAYGAHLGSILYNLLPPEIQHGETTLPHTHHVETTTTHVPEVLEAKRTDRYSAYRSLVRETFAHAGSVLVVTPSSGEAEEVYRNLAKGIEDRTILLSGAGTKKKFREAYQSLEDFSRPKLIIATPTYAILERHDITVTIIDEARSSYYRALTRPYLDYRDVLVTHSKLSGRRIVLGDMLPRTEEEWLRRTEVYGTFGDTPRRIELPGTLSIIDTTPPLEKSDTPYSMFSETAQEVIRGVKKKKEHLFIYAARRGLAPIVTCGDCGHVFRSPTSGAPYALHRTTKQGVEERWFLCSTSGERVRAADTCPECGSWRLRERGIGIQAVHDELRKLAPQTPIILFDRTTATTYKKAQFLKDTFYDTRGAIMLGTSMALPYLTNPITSTLVVSMDALLTTPTWRLEEENLSLLLRLREVTTGSVFIQTKSKEHELLSYAKHAEVERFYTDEIELRKTFNYPPFATFIHFTWQAPHDEARKIEALLNEQFLPYAISTYPSPLVPKNGITMHGLIRVPQSSWPNGELIALLKALPPSIRTVINPDRII